MTDTPASAKSAPIVVMGATLAYSSGGKPAYVYRLLHALASAAPDRALHLLVPDGTRLEALPPAIALTRLPRRLAGRRALVSEIASNFAIGDYAARHHRDAVFITPADFWSLRHPRRTLAVTHDALSEVDAQSAGSALRRLYRRLCIRYAKRSRLWVTISDFAADEIAAAFGGKKPLALPNWVDRKYTLPVPPAEIAALCEKFRLPPRFILYVGGFSHYKNVGQLIRAHAEASRRTSMPPLVIAGNIPTQDQTFLCDVRGEIRRSRCTENAVLMPGFIDETDMPALYAAASLFVSPSLHEGFGYPPVEAMALGCPVLVADRSSFREIVPQARSRFDPDDHEEFIARLIEAAHAPEHFRCPFPSQYSETAGITRYLDAIRTLD